MSDLEDKLNAILGNREAMGQIMAIARSLGDPGEIPSDADVGACYEPVEPAREETADLSSMLGGIDPNMMQMGMRLLREYNRGDDRNTALLAALRPFVKESRFAKVDRAIQIARLSRVIRVLFDVVKEKGEGGLV